MNRFRNNCDKTSDRPVILCPCPPPKRLLTSSNWIARNDSSNINAILHPDNHLVSPRLKYNEKTRGDVKVKHILSRNNCYCRCKSKQLQRPTFFKSPNSCVSYEVVSTTKIAEEYEDDLQRKSLTSCVCKEVDEDVSETEQLTARVAKVRQSKSAPVGGGLKQKYEEYLQNKLSDDEDNEEYQRIADPLGAGDSGNVETILGTQKFGTGTSLSEYYGSSAPIKNNGHFSDDLATDEYPVYPESSVPNIRKEHYFETQYNGKVGEITGDVSKDQHTCVHQFKLDNRWLPEPLNTDAFGRSICKICEKPMEGPNISVSSGSWFSGNGISQSKLKNFAEAYKIGFSPTTINLGKGKSTIELILNDRDVTKFSNYINRSKKPVYYNSLALRHQRMRMI